MLDANTRLQTFRERANLGIEKLANAMDISLESYHDLEHHDDEIYVVLSLRELTQLARTIGIRPIDIFIDEPSQADSHPRRDFESLARAVTQLLASRGQPLDAFEDEIGWGIGAFLQGPQAALEWNITCLRGVCDAVGCDWLELLSDLERHVPR